MNWILLVGFCFFLNFPKAVAANVTFDVEPHSEAALVDVRAVQGHGLSGDILIQVSLTSPVVREEQLAAANGLLNLVLFIYLSDLTVDLDLVLVRKRGTNRRNDSQKRSFEYRALLARTSTVASSQVVSGTAPFVKLFVF